MRKRRGPGTEPWGEVPDEASAAGDNLTWVMDSCWRILYFSVRNDINQKQPELERRWGGGVGG